MVVEAIPSRGSRLNRVAASWRRFLGFLHLMEGDPLDSTGMRRRMSDDDGTFRASGSGVNFPTAILLFLAAQLAGGIWWAATLQSKVDTMNADNIKLWQKIETIELQYNHTENGLDEKIRGKVRETMDDWGYLRVPRKGQ